MKESGESREFSHSRFVLVDLSLLRIWGRLRVLSMRWILSILITMSVAAAAAGPQSDETSARALCDALLKDRHNPEAIEAFRAGIGRLEGAEEIRTHLMAVCGLGMLSLGQADAFQAVDAYLEREHADSPALQHLAPDALTVACPTCDGQKQSACKTCRGSPRCARCEGKGWIPGAVIAGIKTRPACPSCRGTGKCATCSGRGHLPCAPCGGKGRIWDPARIRLQYEVCLRDTRQRAWEHEHPEMLAVRRTIDTAKRCYTIDQSIQLLEDIIARHPASPNISIAKKELAAYRRDKEESDVRVAAKRLLVEQAKHKPRGAQDAARLINELIGRFMLAQQKGEAGTACWADARDARHVFSPVSWQSLKTTIVGAYAEVRFRVEADGVGPSAMRNGTIYLTFQDDWKIQMVKMEGRDF